MKDKDNTIQPLEENSLGEDSVNFKQHKEAHPVDSEETSLKKQVDDLTQQLEEAKNDRLRAVAETENVRRRSVKEKEDAHKYAAANFGRDVVGIIDNIQRALS